MKTLSSRCCHGLLLACVAFQAAPARALDLTGTWSVTKNSARCKLVNFGGGSFSTLEALGPLQISHDAQHPFLIHLRTSPDDVDYQGVEAPEPPIGHHGTAVATSCQPFTLGITYYRGEFAMNADDVHGRMTGKFIGNDSGGLPMSCRFTAKRTSTADPGIPACP